MIKDILDNKFFVILLYLIGLLFFIKIDSNLIPPCINKYCHHPLIIFITLIILLVVLHFNIPLGIFATTIYLYYIVITVQYKNTIISENFQDKNEGADDDDDDDDDEQDEDDNTEEELEKMEEEVKKEEEEEEDTESEEDSADEK